MAETKFSIVSFCLFLSLTYVCFSASVGGIVYDENVNPAKGATVTLEKEQSLQLYGQVITSQGGDYNFSFPPGMYRLTAMIKKNNQILQTSVSLNLSADDNVTVDLLLLPELGLEVQDLAVVEEEQPFAAPIEEVQVQQVNWILILVIFVLFIAAIVTYFGWKKKTEEMEKEIREIKLKKEELPLGRYLTDEERIYQLVRRRGQSPQKHIVAETGFSKAKVTLILKKLEKLGKVKRETVGREKIIKPAD